MADKSPADKLLAILEKGDESACLKFFDGMPEAERREHAKAVIPFFKKVVKTPFLQSGPNTFVTNPQLPTAAVATLACCTASELKTLGWRAMPHHKTALHILRDRRPDWTQAYAHWLLAENSRHWPLVRTLVRDGICERPQHDNYILGMIVTLDGWGGNELFGSAKRTVRGGLAADPDLLKDEVWRLFQIEGAGELTLAAHDKYISKKGTEFAWNGALKKLSEEGKLSRERLLDESLAALSRGFSQFRVAWFSEFHELLEPTVKERIKRLDKYLVLLASPIPPTVTFALDALDAIDKEQPLPAKRVLEHLPPVLLAKGKGTARRGLAWLARLCQREPECRGAAMELAAQSLTHESAEVQKAALDLIEKQGDRSDAPLREKLAESKALVAASLRKRVDAWLAGSEPAAVVPARGKAKAASPAQAKPRAAGPDLSELKQAAAKLDKTWATLAGVDRLLAATKDGELQIPALDFGPLDVPRLDPAAALEPIQTLDEWIDACAHFLEVPDDIDEGERVLDGISRLCEERPADFDRRIGPLAKRVEKIYKQRAGPFLGVIGEPLRDDVCGIVRAWISGQVVKPVRKRNEHGHDIWVYSDSEHWVWTGAANVPALRFLSQRSLELAQRVAERKSRPLVSAATHRGGWIDPLVLVERLLAWQSRGEEPPRADAALAILRLAPDRRGEALEKLGKSKSELAGAVRYALGGSKPKPGPTEALWIAAARARSGLADDPAIEKAFPERGPDAGTVARYAWGFKKKSFKAQGQEFSYHQLHLAVEPPLPKRVDDDLATVLQHDTKDREHLSAAAIRTLASIWPAGREAHFARGSQPLANNLDWSEAEWGNKAFLEPLLDPDLPLGEMGTLVLCLGLSAKEPGEHGLASDALAGAIADGRVDGAKLAPTMAKLLTTAGIKPGRWAKVFSDVARISPLHLHVVQQILSETLVAAGKDLAKVPKDLHLILELLLELLAESNETVASQLRQLLESFPAGGKAAKTAKALLALPAGDNAAHRESVMEAALRNRVARGQRWQRPGQAT